MDQIDKQLVTGLQTGFPVTDRPYAAIGEQLGIKEQEVIDRIKAIVLVQPQSHPSTIFRSYGVNEDTKILK